MIPQIASVYDLSLSHPGQAQLFEKLLISIYRAQASPGGKVLVINPKFQFLGLV